MTRSDPVPRYCCGDVYGLPRFLCDEMLKGLGRWLRTAGYDTVIHDDGAPDRLMFERAVAEQRCLVTRDRKLMEYRDAMKFVMLLECNGLESCVSELNRRLNIDWLSHSFSRCLLCNTPLSAAERKAWQRVPPNARERATVLLHCPRCNKLYWDGTHVQRMLARLEHWQALRST